MKGLPPFAAALGLLVSSCSNAELGTDIVHHTVEVNDIHLLPTSSAFVDVRDVFLADGSLWVLDGAPPFVARVALGDGEAHQFGAEGEGPGELLDPWAIQPALGPDTAGVLVWDLGSGRVSEFDRSGRFLASATLDARGRVRARSDIREVSYADPFRVRNDGSTFVAGQFSTRIERTADMAGGSLSRSNRLLEPGAELAAFSDHLLDEAQDFREWSPVPFWDACDGLIVLWSPKSREVLWIDPSGEVQERVPVELPVAPVTQEDIQTYLRWMGRLELGPGYEASGVDYPRLAQGYRDRFAGQRPVATDLRCESRDAAWIRTFDTATDPLGRGTDWLRIASDTIIERFRFPADFSPAIFTAQAIYGLLENSEGHQALARWNLGLAE
ncbi:MAG: hypothetical protein HKO65_06120 [Gemmatimonadetes bacterium]|nr:hypothetical protein [Gemmatimonadota bacterium]NNM04662.1 hypothetical protein [Gemmatimonadota bacterium]